MYRKYIPENAKLIPSEAKKVFQGMIYSVWHWNQKMFDGSVKTFEMLKRPDTVEIIAIANDKIIIQEEEQPHLGKFLDIPGGRHDNKGEDELQSAKRELLEETGYTFSDWKLINVVQQASKIDHLNYIFLACGEFSKGKQKLDNGERVKVRLVTFSEFKEIANQLRSYKNYADILTDIKSVEELKTLPDLYKES